MERYRALGWTSLLTSWVDAPGGPAPFYARLGFVPTGNVDDAMAMRLMYLFEELNRMGTTVVIATHNEQLVGKFDYPRLLLANGILAQDGP